MGLNYDDEIINSTNNRLYWLAILIGIISIVCGIVSLNDPPQGIYTYFPIVTIAFGAMSLMFFSVYKKVTWVTVITIAFMFLRYTVSLYILHREGYPKGVYNISVNNSKSLQTALIMIYELIMIYCALYIGQRKYRCNVSIGEYKKKIFSNRNFSHLNVVLVLFVLITIGMFVMYPSLFNNYSFIINSELEYLTDNIISSQAGLPSGMRWLGYTFGEATRYILIEYFLLKIYKRYTLKESVHSRYWWYSVFLALINALITNQRMMLGIFMSLTFFYQIYRLYPSKRKLFVFFGGIIGVFGIGMITITYWTNALTYQSFSQMIQGYTNGFYNVYQATSAYENASMNILEKIEMFFIGDGIGNINLVSILIDGTNSSNIYNYYIYGEAFNGGAVLPLVSQMSFYFSPIIGPIFSFACILLAKKLESASLNSNGNVMIGQFCAFVFAATPFMYNYSTLIHILTIVALPLWICSYINAKNIVMGTFDGI
jgi:hypothetical protein